VFVHGLGGSSSTWETVLGTFAETHRVLALDLPGHGRSDAGDPAAVDYSIAGLARAVRELARVLLVWGEADRVIAVGYADLAETVIPAAQRVIITDAGHAPQIEAADVFAEVVERFISET
jgi:pimeloyl-ACP methyl ester carboxylesterase